MYLQIEFQRREGIIKEKSQKGKKRLKEFESKCKDRDKRKQKERATRERGIKGEKGKEV